jgi:UPF0271 protein
LYNRASKDFPLAVTIAQAIRRFSGQLILVGLAGSQLVEAGKQGGLKVLSEGFADRVYEPDGTLRSRNLPGAVLEDPRMVALQGLELARNGVAARAGGGVVHWKIQTICLHGDEPHAVENAKALKLILNKN